MRYLQLAKRKIIDEHVDSQIRQIINVSPETLKNLGINSVNETVHSFPEVKFSGVDSKDIVDLLHNVKETFKANCRQPAKGEITINGTTYSFPPMVENLVKTLIGFQVSKSEVVSKITYAFTMDLAEQIKDELITFPIIPKDYRRDKSKITRMLLFRLNCEAMEMLDEAGLYYNVESFDKLLKGKKSTKQAKTSKPKSAMEKLNESNK